MKQPLDQRRHPRLQLASRSRVEQGHELLELVEDQQRLAFFDGVGEVALEARHRQHRPLTPIGRVWAGAVGAGLGRAWSEPFDDELGPVARLHPDPLRPVAVREHRGGQSRVDQRGFPGAGVAVQEHAAVDDHQSR